jgi:hypothetical protein
MSLEIRLAERKKAKLRIGMSGPSGSGKTYSALLTARGLATSWEKVLLIDTENGSGELYSDLGPYNVITLSAPFAPERYIEAIDAAEKAGMEVIVIDSTSHEWDGKGGCLEINEKLAAAKFRGNTWSAWSETTPRHQRFIEAIVSSRCHIVTTARAKTDTIQTEDKKIKKVGLKEIQREGFEYELTVNFNIDRDHHMALASKDRTGLFIDRDPFLISEETGKELLAWSESGKDAPPPPPPPAPDYSKDKAKINHNFKRLGFTITSAEMAAEVAKVLTGHDLVEENYAVIVKELEAYKGAEGAQATWGVYVEKTTPPAPDVAPRPVEDTIQYPSEEVNPEDIPF